MKNDFIRRYHEAAALIPRGPSVEQFTFRWVVCELRGRDVPTAEAVRRATDAIRHGAPRFQPRYDDRLLAGAGDGPAGRRVGASRS